MVVCDTDWWRGLAATNTVAYRLSSSVYRKPARLFAYETASASHPWRRCQTGSTLRQENRFVEEARVIASSTLASTSMSSLRVIATGPWFIHQGSTGLL